VLAQDVLAQEARQRWEMMNQIRRDKLDLVLPEVMRENKIDMWITVVREGNLGPLYHDLGGGYIGDWGFYIFSDRGGERIERAALGISGYKIERCGAYDIFAPADKLKEMVAERDPQRIGVNMAESIGAADNLSYTGYHYLKKQLGEPWAGRLVSAEKLISDFRSRRVASEIVAFGRACEIAREIAEQALSNKVITPGATRLEDVAWWMQEELQRRGLLSSFGLPSVYITGPDGIEAISDERIIQRGDLLMIDWGVGLMNFYTDMKRIAYVLKEGESAVPPGLQHAFDQGVKARQVVRQSIRPGKTAAETLEHINEQLRAAGFAILQEWNRPADTPDTEIIVGSHSVGNWGHGVGPSIAFFNPTRLTYTLQPGNLLAIELFAYTPAPEWGGKKVRIPLEDDAVVTDRGIEWLVPANQRILLVF
jgi:Xaa-Pro aminopeptidase